MKNRKLYIVLLIIILLSIPIIMSFAAGNKEEPDMQFNFAFIHKDSEDSIKIMDSNNDVIKLSKGDQVRVFIQPVKNAYIYLYLYDAEKNLLLVFPSKKYLKDDYDFEKCFYIHEGVEWFSDWIDVGEESSIDKFEFIVSKERLSNLESFTKKYLILYYDSTKSEEEKNKAKEKVITELIEMRKEKNEFISESDIQVPLGGGVRGEEITATSVSTNENYGKTVIFQY